MYFLAEILVDIVLALGIVLLQWCIRHKNITMALLAVALVVVDVMVLYYIVKVR